MLDLFKIETVVKANNTLWDNLCFDHLPIEQIPLPQSLGRNLAGDIIANSDIPGFNRSTMDGFAVRAKDTFGATEAMPAYLTLVGEVFMGQEAKTPLTAGQAIKVATGGMLPANADAVVMIEYTEELDQDTIGVVRPVAPGENIVRKGEDLSIGNIVLTDGALIRPQELGILSGLGNTKVPVYRKPRVAIISTGDELVPSDEEPKLGQVRDINSYTIMGLVAECGGQPVMYGIIPDTYEELYKTTADALVDNDLVIISGGSSVGTRDVTAKVLNYLGKPGVLVHGVSVKPGKPTILGVVQGKAVYGLPGHPVSAMIIFNIFVKPVIDKLQGRKNIIPGNIVKALVTRNIASTAGREDYLRVALQKKDGHYWAEPVLGKSGLISTMVKADGIFCIAMDKEGVQAGEEVEVILF